jgi:hypothetical protein
MRHKNTCSSHDGVQRLGRSAALAPTRTRSGPGVDEAVPTQARRPLGYRARRYGMAQACLRYASRGAGVGYRRGTLGLSPGALR